jgi:hypothetical protein
LALANGNEFFQEQFSVVIFKQLLSYGLNLPTRFIIEPDFDAYQALNYEIKINYEIRLRRFNQQLFTFAVWQKI